MYHRPVSQWNKGKRAEFKERKYYNIDKAFNSLLKYKKTVGDGNG
jgi:hypothetical protein